MTLPDRIGLPVQKFINQLQIMQIDSLLSGQPEVNERATDILKTFLEGYKFPYLDSICAYSYQCRHMGGGAFKYLVTIHVTQTSKPHKWEELKYSLKSSNAAIYDLFISAELDSEDYNTILLNIFADVLQGNRDEVLYDLQRLNHESENELKND